VPARKEVEQVDGDAQDLELGSLQAKRRPQRRGRGDEMSLCKRAAAPADKQRHRASVSNQLTGGDLRQLRA
jgi:hypothetical protein